eukprot:g6190.t1
MNNELEQKLTSACSDDALVIPASAESERKRPKHSRIKVTRNGNLSLDIEYPCFGEIKYTRLLSFACIVFNLGMVLSLVAGFMLFLEAKSGDISYWQKSGLHLLYFSGFLFLCESIRYTKLNLRITPDGYHRVISDMTWKSFLQIMFLPWHFNDFENAQYVKPDKEDLQFDWSPAFKERMKTQAFGDSHIERCKQSYSPSEWESKKEEILWLYDEFNTFLREASQSKEQLTNDKTYL